MFAGRRRRRYATVLPDARVARESASTCNPMPHNRFRFSRRRRGAVVQAGASRYLPGTSTESPPRRPPQGSRAAADIGNERRCAASFRTTLRRSPMPFGLGFGELVLIFGVLLLLFGA